MKIRLLEAERATMARVQGVLTAAFVRGEETRFNATTKTIKPMEEGMEPLEITTLILPINTNGEPTSGSNIEVILKKEEAGNIKIKRVKGRENLDGKRLPQVVFLAIKKVNATFKNHSRKERITQTIDPNEIDKIDPRKQLRRGEVE